MARLNKALRAQVNEAVAFAFAPPAIPGIGSTGGFSFWLQDRSGGTVEFLYQNLQKFLEAARKRPELANVNAPFRAAVPQVYADVDQEKVLKQGVAVGDVYQTLQAFLGGLYVNQFNRFGRQWRVFLQAEAEDRLTPEDIGLFYVRNGDGNMVPLSTVVSTRRLFGPEYTQRFNLFRAAQITGQPAPGYSSGPGDGRHGGSGGSRCCRSRWATTGATSPTRRRRPRAAAASCSRSRSASCS